MRQAIKLFILSLVLLTACAQAPVLDSATGESKTSAFLASVSTDPGTAYAGTSARFQSTTTEDGFKTYVDQSKLKSFNSFAITGISYQQGVGINAAKVDGDIIFTDLTKQNASFIWTYDNAKKDWYLDAFKFN